MTEQEREQMHRDIIESFEFVRFLIKNPAVLKKLKNNAEIKIFPAASRRSLTQRRFLSRVQTFTAETIFHSLNFP